MRIRAFAAALIAAPCFTLPAAAQTAPSAPPITINSCAPELDNSSNAPSIAGIPISSNSMGIKIEFVNESSKAADLINFDVNSNGQQFVIRDVGTFSPGVSITHKYRNGEGQSFVLPSFISPKISCEVASVRFTDGTYWTKGQAAASPSTPGAPASTSKISATPSNVIIDRTTESDLFLVSSSAPITAFKESDNCSGVATVFVAATGQSTATYSVKPVSPGSCMATITDEAGDSLTVPITVR